MSQLTGQRGVEHAPLGADAVLPPALWVEDELGQLAEQVLEGERGSQHHREVQNGILEQQRLCTRPTQA